MINLQKITFGYDNQNQPILADFSMIIKRNERVAILGRSGEGKSTLVSIIAGYLNPSSGKVIIDGSETRKPKKTIVMSQENDIFDWLTVQQNMHLVCTDTHKVEHFLEAVGLSDNLLDRGYTLSVGMKKRLSFARALAVGADILILDEPFSSLDHPRRQKLYAEFIRASKATNTTVILVTHDIHEAVSLCDKIYLLKGRPAKLQKISTKGNTPRATEQMIKKLLAEN